MDSEDITLYTSLLIIIIVAFCEIEGIFVEPELLRTDRRRSFHRMQDAG